MIGIPYFYIIKHTPTGKYYAGCKINSAANSSNLMTKKGYKTTSKIVKNLIKTDGLESFEILKIKHFGLPDQALDYETRFLLKVNAAENERFLNRHNGGKNFHNKGGYNLSESTKQKMRKPKSKETIEKQNKAKKERPKEVYEKMVESRRKNNSCWNSKETGEKIAAANTLRFKNEENRKHHSEIMVEYYKNNPVSEETREKHSELSSGENNPMFGKKHSDATKEKLKAAWVKRRKNSDRTSGI